MTLMISCSCVMISKQCSSTISGMVPVQEFRGALHTFRVSNDILASLKNLSQVRL